MWKNIYEKYRWAVLRKKKARRERKRALRGEKCVQVVIGDCVYFCTPQIDMQKLTYECLIIFHFIDKKRERIPRSNEKADRARARD